MVVTSRRARASLLLLALILPLLAACSSDGSDASTGAGGSDGAGGPAAQAPTGSPFSMTITGPDTATAGQTITATLTNTGRLPDGYRLVPDPFVDATIAQPEVRLGPGEKTEVEIQVVTVPFLVRVESISGGQGGSAGVLSVGEQD